MTNADIVKREEFGTNFFYEFFAYFLYFFLERKMARFDWNNAEHWELIRKIWQPDPIIEPSARPTENIGTPVGQPIKAGFQISLSVYPSPVLEI